MADIGRMRVFLGLDDAEFDKALKKAERGLRGFGERLKKIGSGLTFAVSAPLGGIGIAALRAADGFQTELIPALRDLQDDVRGVFREIGNALLPTFVELAGLVRSVVVPVLQNLAAIFRELPDSVKSVIAVVGLFAVGLGPLLFGLGTMVQLAGSLTLAIKGLAVGLAFLTAHPLVALLTGLAAAVVALGIYLFSSRQAEIQNEKTTRSFQQQAGALRELDRVALEQHRRDAQFVAALKSKAELLEKVGLAEKKLAAFGVLFDPLPEKITAARAAIEDLLKAGLDPLDQDIQKIRANLDRWIQAQRDQELGAERARESLKLQNQALQEHERRIMTARSAWDEWTAGIRLLATDAQFAMNKALSGLAGGIQQFSDSFGEAMGRAAVFGKNFSKAMGRSIQNMAAQFIASLLSMTAQLLIFTVIAIALGNTRALAELGQAAARTYAGVFASVVTALPFPVNIIVAAAIAAGTVALMLGVAKAFLAEGGIVTGPLLAMIGEAGPEVVLPLDRLDRFLGAGGDSTVIVELDGYQIARATIPHTHRVVRMRLGGATI